MPPEWPVAAPPRCEKCGTVGVPSYLLTSTTLQYLALPRLLAVLDHAEVHHRAPPRDIRSDQSDCLGSRALSAMWRNGRR